MAQLKSLLLTLILLASTSLASELQETKPYRFTIRGVDYRLSTEFQIDSQDTYPGVINKSCLRIRTHYDLYSPEGWQATGVKRFFCMGTFSTPMTEIDVYDTGGQKIGMIDGQFASTEPAKLSLYSYDESGNYGYVGTAYLDEDLQGFSIYAQSKLPLARLDRIWVQEGKDYWEVCVNNPEQLDDRLIRIFAAWAIDSQNAFYIDDIDRH